MSAGYKRPKASAMTRRSRRTSAYRGYPMNGSVSLSAVTACRLMSRLVILGRMGPSEEGQAEGPCCWPVEMVWRGQSLFCSASLVCL